MSFSRIWFLNFQISDPGLAEKSRYDHGGTYPRPPGLSCFVAFTCEARPRQTFHVKMPRSQAVSYAKKRDSPMRRSRTASPFASSSCHQESIKLCWLRCQQVSLHQLECMPVGSHSCSGMTKAQSLHYLSLPVQSLLARYSLPKRTAVAAVRLVAARSKASP